MAEPLYEYTKRQDKNFNYRAKGWIGNPKNNCFDLKKILSIEILCIGVALFFLAIAPVTLNNSKPISDYFLLTHIAEEKLKSKDFDSAFLLYDCAANRFDSILVLNDAIAAAACAFKLNKLKYADYFLTMAAKSGGGLDYMKGVTYLKEFTNHKIFLEFESQYPTHYLKFSEQLDSSSMDVIKTLIKSDKKMRTDPNRTGDGIKKLDLENAVKLKDWIEYRGVPEFYQLDKDSRMGLYGLFLHFCYYEESAEYFSQKSKILLENRIITPFLYKYLLERSSAAIQGKISNSCSHLSLFESDEALLKIGMVPKGLSTDSLFLLFTATCECQ